MHRSTIVLCTVLALSSALPHKWHWSQPDHPVETAAEAQEHEWHWNKQRVTNSHLQSLTATAQQTSVEEMDECKSVVGKLNENGVNIRRSYHLCAQENPLPEQENIVTCFYSTATCCSRSGLPLSSASITVNGLKVTVKYYSTGNKQDMCYSTEPEVPSCIKGINCIPMCTNPDPVCLNQTLAGDETSCSNLVCECAKGYAQPDCCECDRGFSKINGICEPLCLNNCEIPDPVLGCTRCRPEYATEPECCNCDVDFYETPDGTCGDPCRENIVGCQDGVCTCKARFGGPDCCQCRDNAVANGCTDDGCVCQEGYAAPTCCDCAPGFFRAADGTCQPPCRDNTVNCQDGVCTCKTGFGGPDCCQCRDNAVANSCTDTACECQEGYAAPTCCDCVDDFYRASDGTCKKICVDSAVTCTVAGCTVCADGYTGPDCCDCAPDFYRSTDGTCQPPCEDNIVSCEDGECTCKAGFGGPDCCQCRDNAVANSCTDTACVCQEGYVAPTCCECAPGFFRAADGTCQPPCRDNIVSCQNGVCTCQTGFGGPDCCQCRDFAVADTCTDTACQCQDGYATPDCCQCDDNYYRASDGTCQKICVDSAVTCTVAGCTVCADGYAGPDCCDCAPDFYRSTDGTCQPPCNDNIVSCQNGVCTCKAGFGGPDCCLCSGNAISCTDTSCECREGFTGTDCCAQSCTGVQDIYFVVDVTLSNFAAPFCSEMYAIELISESVNPRTDLVGTRIGSYLYPLAFNTDASGMRYFKVGSENCKDTVESYHTLMEAVSRGIQNEVRPKVLGGVTYPAPVIDLVASDIEAEIASENAPADRPRVIVTLTDGGNDGSAASLVSAVNRLKIAGSKTTLIAAGIATSINTDNMADFEAGVQVLAGNVAANTIIATLSGIELGLSLVDVMERNGAICSDQAQGIKDRIQNNGDAYCKCNFRQGCKAACPTTPAECRLPPTDHCTAKAAAVPVENHFLEEEILAAVENVLKGIPSQNG